jgi:hypothetical protein
MQMHYYTSITYEIINNMDEFPMCCLYFDGQQLCQVVRTLR